MVIFYGAGVYFYGLGVFFNPIIEEFHWSATATSVVFSLKSAETGALAPVVGFLVDRYGPRVVMLAGTAILGAGFLLMSRMESLLNSMFPP